MRVAIVTVGSLGDVRPYAALGAGLRAGGHAVRLVTHERFRPLAGSCDLEFAPLSGDPDEVLLSPAGQRWQHSGRNVVGFMRGFRDIIQPLMHAVAAESYAACRDAELLVASLLGFCASYHVAEKLRVPLLPAFYLPLSPTRSFPSVMFTATRSFGGALNLLTHQIAGLGLWEPLRPTLNRVRREVLDLPPMRLGQVQREIVGGRFPILYGYSPTLVPPARDWHDRIHVTGYWSMGKSAAWTPSPALAEFLSAGPPPVYIGFGSMRLADPDGVAGVVARALAATGHRGLLFTGENRFDAALPDSILRIGAVPHEWLFPRTAAVVHHCGAGTTATALGAGVPSVGVPFFADQPFWSARLAAIGAAPPPIPFRRLSAAALADAIRVATAAPMRARAAALGEQVREEHGVARAVEIIGRLV